MSWSRLPPAPVASLPSPQQELLRRLRSVAGELGSLERQAARVREVRLGLYREGLELGLTKSHLGTAAGCSPEAVTKALARAAAAGA